MVALGVLYTLVSCDYLLPSIPSRVTMYALKDVCTIQGVPTDNELCYYNNNSSHWAGSAIIMANSTIIVVAL